MIKEDLCASAKDVSDSINVSPRISGASNVKTMPFIMPPQQNLWVLSDSPWPLSRLYGSRNWGFADIRHRSKRLVLVPGFVPGLRDAMRFTG